MVRSLVRRTVSAVLLFLVGAGGGGVPVLDILFFHDSERSEAFRPHYEASSSSCHQDGCSVCSLTQTRLVSHAVAQSRLAAPLERPGLGGFTERVLCRDAAVRYLSRAPPPSA